MLVRVVCVGYAVAVTRAAPQPANCGDRRSHHERRERRIAEPGTRPAIRYDRAVVVAPWKFHRMHARASRLLPRLVFAWVQAVLLLWWVAQWPGLLSPDSVTYVLQVTSGPWTADHSVLYDAASLPR